MKVKILKFANSETVTALIKHATGLILLSLGDGWRFNFNKHSKKRAFQTYVLVCDSTPNIIEGCLTFQLRDTVEPYMAYIEVAPHNKGEAKLYDKVAGCLIAYACRLSFINGVEHFKGWLTFDVMEESKQDEIKLMAVYCKKYGALKWGDTTMVISPEAGEKLIDTFLK
jgi:hypothetical protein